MNLRKTAALLLSLIMCFSLILPVGSLAEGTVTAADNAKRSENLLAFAGRLHNMTEKYSAEYTKKQRIPTPMQTDESSSRAPKSWTTPAPLRM